MAHPQIPGFYFDEEKQKYFQIQPGHLLPERAKAKYSEGEVNREKRKSDVREVEHRKHTRRVQQMVKRNPLLQHPMLSGIALLREHGTRRTLQDLDTRDRAMLSTWSYQVQKLAKPSETEQRYQLAIAHYIPETQQMVVAFNHPEVSSTHSLGVYTYWDWNNVNADILEPPNQIPTAHFRHAIKSVASTTQGNAHR